MDPTPFDQWYREEHPRLVSALVVVAGDLEPAQEAVDEAFARAYERWSRVQRMAAPSGWTYRTALNVLHRRARRSSMEARLHRRRVADDRASVPPSDWSPEVWDALGRLPLRERTAIALRYVADLSTDDIATAMGVAPGTVGSTLHTARHRLAEVLADTALEEVPDA